MIGIKPGEGDRAIQADADVSVAIAYADAANLLNLAKASSSLSDKKLFMLMRVL